MKKPGLNVTLVVCVLGYALAIVLRAADDIFDIPHNLFNAPATPINWTQILIESIFLLIAGGLTILLVNRLERRRRKAEEQSIHLDKVMRLIRRINQLIVKVDDESQLLHEVCRQLIARKDYKLAWIGYIQEGSYDILPVAQMGSEDGYLSSVKITWDDTEYGQAPSGIAIRTGEPCVARDFVDNPQYHLWREEALERGYQSAAAFPLRVRNEVIGALIIYSEYSDEFDKEEVALLVEMAGDISLGIEKIRQRKERETIVEALREREELYSQLTEYSQVGIYISQANRFVFVNPRFVNEVGFTEDELLNKAPADLVHPQDREHVHRKAVEMLKGHSILPYTFRAIHKNGETCHVMETVAPITFRGNRASLGCCMDITERVRMEDSLRDSEQNFQNSLDNSPMGIHIVNSQGETIYGNRAILKIYGYDSLEELQNTPVQDRYSPESYEEHLQRKKERKNGREINGSYEISIVRKDGTPRNLRVFRDGVFWNHTMQFQVIYEDITEQKQAEQTIISLSHFPEENPHPVLRVRNDGKLLYANRASEALLKHWQVNTGEYVKEHIGELVKRVLAENCVEEIEVDLQDIVLSCLFAPIPTADYVNVYARNITNRKLNEERIKHLNQVLRALRNINQLITREKNRERLIQQSCDLMVQTRGFFCAWILLFENEKKYVSAAVADGEDLQAFREQLEQGDYPPCVGRILAHEDTYATCDNVAGEGPGCLPRGEHIEGRGLICRLEYEGKVYGVMSVYVPLDYALDANEKSLFKELAGDIAFALYNIGKEEERTQAEEQAMQISERLQLQVARMPIALITFDAEFRVQNWNPAAEKIFGYTAQEALGKSPYDLMIPKEAQPQVDAIWNRLLNGDIKANSINENITKDGRTILCKWSNTPLKKADGTIIGVLSMAEDITAQKQAEKRLKASEERFRMIFEYAPDAYYMNDLEGHFIDGNKAAERMSGYKRSELIGKSFFDLKMLAPKAIPEAAALLARNATGQPTGPDEFNLIRNDGSQVTVEITSFPVEMEGKHLVLSIARDVTERRKMAERLMVTDRLASLGELASGIAHEINNPLTGIIGLSELVLDADVPADVKEDLNTIHNEAQRTAKIVEGLLAFARKQPGEKKSIDVHEAILNVLKLRAYEQKVSNIEVITRFVEHHPQIAANAFQLQQVFINIIINAEYFMTEAHGRGTLTVTTEHLGDALRISFTDDGPGISREVLEHIFDPFFTTKEVGMGTGLGLSICHGIIAEHGGRIYAESQLGAGASFIIELPISDENRRMIDGKI